MNEIENTYGVSGFPTTFYVDRRGIIREIYRGGPGKQNDKDFLQELRKNVDRLLAEK